MIVGVYGRLAGLAVAAALSLLGAVTALAIAEPRRGQAAELIAWQRG
jgi:hypothetical protein